VQTDIIRKLVMLAVWYVESQLHYGQQSA